jgi:hypothetical protein
MKAKKIEITAMNTVTHSPRVMNHRCVRIHWVSNFAMANRTARMAKMASRTRASFTHRGTSWLTPSTRAQNRPSQPRREAGSAVAAPTRPSLSRVRR